MRLKTIVVLVILGAAFYAGLKVFAPTTPTLNWRTK